MRPELGDKQERVVHRQSVWGHLLDMLFDANGSRARTRVEREKISALTAGRNPRTIPCSNCGRFGVQGVCCNESGLLKKRCNRQVCFRCSSSCRRCKKLFCRDHRPNHRC